MRSLGKPLARVRSVLHECTVALTNEGLARRIAEVIDEIEAAETTYNELGNRAELFVIQAAEKIGDLVTRDEMVWLYNNKLSKKGQAARKIYDEIKASPHGGICPLCSHRFVSTLDHYLAKTEFPVYAVTPLNLVPSCSDCNKGKGTRQSSTPEEQILHPYFDNIGDEVWLKSQILKSYPVGVVFFVDPPNSWLPVMRARVQAHFETFGLAELYAANSAQELAQIRHALHLISESSGVHGVREHLTIQAESRSRDQLNSWQAALYRALAVSEWFWNNGY